MEQDKDFSKPVAIAVLLFIIAFLVAGTIYLFF